MQSTLVNQLRTCAARRTLATSAKPLAYPSPAFHDAPVDAHGLVRTARPSSEDPTLPLSRSPRPTVLVLGWWNAAPHHLHKYVALHLQRGANVVYATLPAHCVLVPLVSLDTNIRRLRDGLARATDNRPLTAVHTLSNNGAYAYAFANALRPISTAHSVCDSGPSFMTPENLVAGTLGAVLPPGSATPAWVTDAARRYLGFGPHARIIERLHAALADLPPCPTLLLGGHRDRIVPPASIVELASKCFREDRTAAVWFDSGHVEHFRRFPREYRRVVDAFLRDELPMGIPPLSHQGMK
ncbi:hypothetical protein H9P43_001846 [Blastocladiella emersonii ATCC 22665]|nr:hypothetical protein H9P43_001846 [Blastocladiella emersonii ATCC 22665]